jgi:hypothetical protein
MSLPENIKYVKPAEGARIIQPNRNYRAMPVEGDYIDTNDVFYVRLLLSKDIVECDPPAAAEETKPIDTETKPVVSSQDVAPPKPDADRRPTPPPFADRVPQSPRR